VVAVIHDEDAALSIHGHAGRLFQAAAHRELRAIVPIANIRNLHHLVVVGIGGEDIPICIHCHAFWPTDRFAAHSAANRNLRPVISAAQVGKLQDRSGAELGDEDIARGIERYPKGVGEPAEWQVDLGAVISTAQVRKLHHPLIASIGDEEIARCIQRHAIRMTQSGDHGGLAAVRPVAQVGHLHYPVVHHIGDEDVARLI